MPITANTAMELLAVMVHGIALRMVVSKTTIFDIGGTKSSVVYVEARFSYGVDEEHGPNSPREHSIRQRGWFARQV